MRVVEIVLLFEKDDLDPKKLEEFWQQYIASLPYVGLSGIPEGQYIKSGATVHIGMPVLSTLDKLKKERGVK